MNGTRNVFNYFVTLASKRTGNKQKERKKKIRETKMEKATKKQMTKQTNEYQDLTERKLNMGVAAFSQTVLFR